jgi:hypothetical protein
MTRRIFIDTEWTAPPWSQQSALMWMGLADEDGRTWYGISGDVEINLDANAFVSGLAELIPPDEPRLTRAEMASAVVNFCGEVDEFWAWIPTIERFAEWFHLGAEATDLFDKCWDVDLQMLRGLVTPWPTRWPDRLLNLNAAAVAAGVELPPRAANHLHPRVHVEWNRQLFARIDAANTRNRG